MEKELILPFPGYPGQCIKCKGGGSKPEQIIGNRPDRHGNRRNDGDDYKRMGSQIRFDPPAHFIFGSFIEF